MESNLTGNSRTKASRNNHRLYALQGLRAYAAAMVIFVHAISTYDSKVDVISGPIGFDGLGAMGLGEMGVKLFFCISGFIIFNATKGLVPAPGSVTTFWRRRIIRVVPIYWLATLVYAVKLALQGAPPTLATLGMSLFFVPFTNDIGLMRPVLGVGWSLNFEMFFYAMFGISLLLTKQFRALSLFCALVLLVAFRMGGYLTQGNGFLLDGLYQLSDYYLFYFLAGLLIGVLREKLAESKTTVSLNFTCALLGCTGILVLYLGLHHMFVVPPFFREATQAGACVLCVAISVLEFKPVNHRSDGLVKRSIGLAGDASYSTYLTHGFAMGPIARVISYAGLDIGALFFSLLMIPVCTCAGILVFRWVERPLMRNLNSRFA